MIDLIKGDFFFIPYASEITGQVTDWSTHGGSYR